MAVMAGKDGRIKVGEKNVGYIDNWSINVNRATIETSQIGKDYKEFIHGPFDWSGSMSGTYDASDPAQKEVMGIFTSGGEAKLSCVFKANNEMYLKGTILPSSVSITGSHGDKIAFSCNFQGTGDLTQTATDPGAEA